jgi:hypothetical protein
MKDKLNNRMIRLLPLLILLFSGSVWAQTPTITGFSPQRGGVGTTITITGTNFSTTPASNIVWFGAVQSPVITATTTTLTVKVPAGASYDRISVTTNSLTAWTREKFLPTFQGTGIIDYTTLADNVDFNFWGVPWPELKVHDFDGDGKPDIIGSAQSKIFFFRNTSTPGTIDAGSLSTYELDLGNGNRVSGFTFCDVDNDGKKDLACVYYNITQETYYPLPPGQPSIDYDVLNPYLRIYKNQSVAGTIDASSFGSYVDKALPVQLDFCPDGYDNSASLFYTAYLESVDLNLDGKEDLVIQVDEFNEYNLVGCPQDSEFLSTTVYQNNYSGSITSTTFSNSYSLNSYSGNNLSRQNGMAICNINVDSKPEIIPVSNTNNQYDYSNIYRNVSATGGSISFSTDYTNAAYDDGRVYAVDFDRDGKDDLYSEGTIMQNNVVGSVFNLTDFGTRFALSGSYPLEAAFADFNGDGTIDICQQAGSSALNLVPNNHTSGPLGYGSFGSATSFTTYGGSANALASNDIDLDGKPDVIFINSNGKLSIMRNQTATTGSILTIGDVSGGIGSTASVPVTATDLVGVEGFQFTISYDQTKLSYQSCTDWDAGVNPSNVLITNNAGTGKLTFVYNDQAFSIANGTFFNINFSVIASSTGSTDVTWSDSPTPREFINSIPNILDITYEDGSVDIVNSLYSISGIVSYENGTSTPMANIPVDLLDNTQTVINSTVTDGSGQYTFSGVANGNYTVRPSTNKPWGGVTSFDITVYKKHIGNVPGFNLTGIKLGSGDVNQSTTLTSLDLTLIKQRIGAQISSFISGDWLFEDDVVTVSGGNLTHNIKAICFGDGSGSHVPQ